MCFFKVKNYFGHISGNIGPIDVKRKGSASVGYWVKYVTLTFDLTHDLDLGCFKVKFRNISLRNCWSNWCEIIMGWVKWYWADCMTFPFDHTLDLDLRVQFRGQSLRNGTADWHGTKRMWVTHSWPWLVWPWWGGWMYRIVTGETSDVGVPSTYLVSIQANCRGFWKPTFYTCKRQAHTDVFC